VRRGLAGGGAAFGLTLAGLVWGLRRRIAVVTVVGESMQPAFRSGDRVLVRRAGLSHLRPGVVVVVEKPADSGAWSTPLPSWPGRSHDWMIKRVAALPGDTLPDLSHSSLAFPSKLAGSAGDRIPAGNFVVLGDNAAGSYDSRFFGYCPASRLLGVVVRRCRGARW